jgi:hypothetical protein
LEKLGHPILAQSAEINGSAGKYKARESASVSLDRNLYNLITKKIAGQYKTGKWAIR